MAHLGSQSAHESLANPLLHAILERGPSGLVFHSRKIFRWRCDHYLESGRAGCGPRLAFEARDRKDPAKPRITPEKRPSVDQPGHPHLRPVPPAETVRRPKPANDVHELCTNWLQNTRKKGPKTRKNDPISRSFALVCGLPGVLFSLFCAPARRLFLELEWNRGVCRLAGQQICTPAERLFNFHPTLTTNH